MTKISTSEVLRLIEKRKRDLQKFSIVGEQKEKHIRVDELSLLASKIMRKAMENDKKERDELKSHLSRAFVEDKYTFIVMSLLYEESESSENAEMTIKEMENELDVDDISDSVHQLVELKMLEHIQRQNKELYALTHMGENIIRKLVESLDLSDERKVGDLK